MSELRVTSCCLIFCYKAIEEDSEFYCFQLSFQWTNMIICLLWFLLAHWLRTTLLCSTFIFPFLQFLLHPFLFGSSDFGTFGHIRWFHWLFINKTLNTCWRRIQSVKILSNMCPMSLSMMKQHFSLTSSFLISNMSIYQWDETKLEKSKEYESDLRKTNISNSN